MTHNADPFTRDRFAWLRQVWADHALPPMAFKLAFAVSEHINRATGEAWPTQQTLGTEIGCSDRTVRTLIYQLRDHGHLSFEIRRGRHISNLYRLVFKDRKQDSGSTDRDKRKQGSGIPSLKPEAQIRIGGGKTGRIERENQKLASGKQEPSFRQNPLTNSLSEPIEGETLSNDRFNEFWEAYPKRVSREGARRAYFRVLKRGLAREEELIAGAQSYAEERRGKEPRYTKHASNWLEDGCWTDEPAQSSAARSVFEGIAGFGNDAGCKD